MNELEIEKLLQSAPRITAPAGLLRQLQAEIDVAGESPSQASLFDPQPWFKRWLPALSFAAFFIMCLIVLGVQSNLLAELRRQNVELRAGSANLEQLREANAEYQRLKASGLELEQLRTDNADARRLRAEVASLRAQLPEIDKLRVENQKLLAANLARTPKSAQAGSDDDFIAKAERIKCVNNLKQVCLAGRIWAGDNADIYPPNFICMTNELSSPVILYCPSDKARQPTDWSAVASGNISYQMLGPGLNSSGDPRVANDPYTVFVMCPIHHNVGLLDGSVAQLTPAKAQQQLKIVNGLTVLAHE